MENKVGFKSIVGNSMWQISEKIITLLISVFITSIIARYLGTEGYGTVNYIVSVVMLFTAFSTLGMEKITINDLLKEEKCKEKILGTSFIIRVIGGIVLILISQIVLYILDDGNVVSQILGVILGISMLFKAFEVIEYYLQSQSKLKTLSIIRFISAIVVAIFKILVVCLDWGIIAFIFSYVVDTVSVAILFWIWYRTKNKEKWCFSKEYAKKLLSKCWYVAISGLMTTLYMRIDQIMLGTMFESKFENGIYSAAVRIAEMWYFVPLAVIAAFQPTIIKSKNEEKGEEYLDNMQKLYDFIAIIGIGFGILISIFGKLAINILYGEEYIKAYSVLLISVWAGLFATLGSARSVWLIIENLQKYTIAYTLCGSVLNILLNAIFIPKYGAFGAAFATLLTQGISNIFVLMIFKKTRISSFMILKSIFKNELLKNFLSKACMKFKKRITI